MLFTIDLLCFILMTLMKTWNYFSALLWGSTPNKTPKYFFWDNNFLIHPFCRELSQLSSHTKTMKIRSILTKLLSIQKEAIFLLNVLFLFSVYLHFYLIVLIFITFDVEKILFYSILYRIISAFYWCLQIEDLINIDEDIVN